MNLKKKKVLISGVTTLGLLSTLVFSTPNTAPAANGELVYKGVNTVSVNDVAKPIKTGKAHFLIESYQSKIPKGLLKSLKEVPANNELYVIQLEDVITQDERETLEAAGVQLIEYIPDYAFVATIKDSDLSKVEGLTLVESVTPYLPLYKLDPRLFEEGASNLVKAVVKKSNQKATKVEAKGLNELISYAFQTDVTYISPESEFQLMNDQAAVITKTTIANNTYGLYGAGQTVAVADTGLDTGVNDSSMHESFQGKITAIYAWGRPNNASDPNGHGTHVAGSVLGNASFKGMAPSASLVFQSIMDANGGLGGLPSNLSDLFSQAYNAGARIHTNSWGAPVNGAYTTDSRTVDQYVYNNDMTILFAAGNEGPGSGTISAPGTAKNAITVGASENYRPSFGSYSDNPDEIASFSSRGPTKDGRVKPDVVAPGTYILSSRSSLAPDSSFWANYNSKYAYMGGTSMATPLTAGNVALLRENFINNYGITPKPSLLKAALIAGATNLGLSNNSQGWGRVNMETSLNVAYVNESTALSTGQKATYTFNATSSKPLRISLVWTDYPGSTSAYYSLVNDLDIVVTSPSGQVYVGNDFSYPYDNNWDGVNNVENVFINNPQSGTYTIEVQAYNVPSGTQKFSLAVVN
jgi:serine protease AprX